MIEESFEVGQDSLEGGSIHDFRAGNAQYAEGLDSDTGDGARLADTFIV
jgi:hypothetical protein